MNLILISPEEVAPDDSAQLTDGRATHIRTVLRAEAGKTLRIGLLNGPLGIGTVERISDESVTIFCEWESDLPPRPAIDLLLAMPRPKVLKRLWAQFAALGVGRIFITNAEKVEKYYFDTHILDSDFYNARLIEGLQQARDTRLPEVTLVKNLKPFLENELFPNIGKKLLADPSGTQSIFRTLDPEDIGTQSCAEQGPDERILLGIGPEGGWTPYEVELFKIHGFKVFGMGSRILRTDTACIVLLGMASEIRRRLL